MVFWRRIESSLSIVLIALSGLFFLAVPASARDRIDTVTVQALNSQLSGGYRVASGDKLRVTVFDEPNLSGDYEVGVEGNLSIPLIESIRAAGQTTSQLKQQIADKLESGGYVLSPRVSVEILEHRPFYILGEVKQPGEYPYSGDLTFEQAVAKAGGFTPRANTKVIYLKRQGESEKIRVRLDTDLPLKISPGDTIVVREAFF